MYLGAGLAALCFSIVDLMTLESMRDRVSRTSFELVEWLEPLILFNSGFKKFYTVYQVFLLSFLARALSHEMRWTKWRP